MASTKYNQKGLSALLKIRHCGFDKQLQFGKSVFGFVFVCFLVWFFIIPKGFTMRPAVKRGNSWESAACPEACQVADHLHQHIGC